MVPARSSSYALGLVLAAAACFIFNAGVSRVVLRAGVDPAVLTTIRVTGATLVFAGWAAAARRSALRPPRGRHLAVVVLLGVVGVAGIQWTYFVAIDRLPVGLALLLQFTGPILVAVYARLVRHEHVRPRAWAGLVVATVGLGLVARVWEGLAFDGLGVLAGFGAAVCFATYFLVAETGVRTEDPLAVVFWSFAVATLTMNVVQPLTGVDVEVIGSSVSMLGALDGWVVAVWLLLAWVVVVGTVTPFALELHALQLLPATTVVGLAMLEPVGVNVLGWAWFGERLDAVQLVGAAGVVVAIGLAQTARSEPAPVAGPVGP